MKRIAALVLLILSFASSARAAERDWPVTSGWDIFQIADGCAMGTEYDGPGETNLMLIVRHDGRSMIGIANSNWSTREEQEYPLRYVLNGRVFAGGGSFGRRLAGRSGFVANFEPGFPDDVAAAGSMRIYNGETLVDQLSLRGSAAALAVVRQCLAVVRAEMSAAQRERQRIAHIPRDPFASAAEAPAAAPPAAARPVPGPRAAQLLSGTITVDDYPAAALRARVQGTVVVRYLVGADGRVASCVLTGSSGDALLDRTTCSLVQRRFRFQPALDAEGNPVAESRTQTVFWRLPPRPPSPMPTATAETAELHPSRHWVQIALGTRAAVDRQLIRLRERAPALLGRREPYLASEGESLRLLVGPFVSAEDATALVAQLAAMQIAASAWRSEDGERVLPSTRWP